MKYQCVKTEKIISNAETIDVALRKNRKNNKVIIMSAIDNLLKGGSGQAVQNMNVSYKLRETLGLK